MSFIESKWLASMRLESIQDQFKDQVYKCKVQPDDQDNWI